MTIIIPGSKSITNRALLLAALANDTSTLTDILLSDDTLAFIQALRQLGVNINLDGTTAIIEGCSGKFPNQTATIQCEDAGTAARFLTAACANSEGNYTLDGSERLRQRPLKTLINTLKNQGAEFGSASLPFTVTGHKLQGGNISIDASESSQFISALLMIAPLMQHDITLHLEQPMRDTYIDMTIAMMKSFGVDVTKSDLCYHIKTGQHYQAQRYCIEPDLSTASYFFAKAANLGSTPYNKNSFKLTNVDPKNCLQGDIKFIDDLQAMGCAIEHGENFVRVSNTHSLQGITVDMNDHSDTFMTLACVAVFATSPTTITNIGHTRLQESDRLAAVCDNLQRCGIQTDSDDDWVRIYPGTPVDAELDSFHDHRIAMAFSLLRLVNPNITIRNKDCVSKTCPEFFEIFGVG